jgi:hypothetical protein
VAPGAPIDVLVIGSGAAGLAAALSAERAGARVAIATKTTLQANNSSKAQGGIQAAFGEDDSPEIHAEDVMRSSHETANPALVEVLTSEAPSAIHWLEELGVEFTRENGGYRLARCGGATRQRLLQVGDRTGHAITKALRETFEAGAGTELPHHRLRALEAENGHWVASFDTKEGSARVTNPRLGLTFSLSWDPEVFRWIVVWMPYGGAFEAPLTGSYALGVEPWTSRHCLEHAVEDGSALELAGGESLSTTVRASVERRIIGVR